MIPNDNVLQEETMENIEGKGEKTVTSISSFPKHVFKSVQW